MEIAELKARALKSREQWLECDGGASFLVRRPSEMDLVRAQKVLRGGDEQTAMESSLAHVIDWRGVLQSDFDASLPGEPAPWDYDLMIMYLNDRVMIGMELCNKIWQMLEKVGDEKKS